MDTYKTLKELVERVEAMAADIQALAQRVAANETQLTLFDSPKKARSKKAAEG